MVIHKKDLIRLMMRQMQVSRYTVYEHLKRKDFPRPTRVVGSYKAYEVGEVAAWLGLTATEMQRMAEELHNHAVA